VLALFIFNIKQPYTYKGHELTLPSPCLLLYILLSRGSRFKRLMFVWYKYTNQYIKRKFTRYLACFETNTQVISYSLTRG